MIFLQDSSAMIGLAALWLLGLGGVYLYVRQLLLTQTTSERLFAVPETGSLSYQQKPRQLSALQRYLIAAGFERRTAPTMLGIALVVSTLLGGLVAFALSLSGLITTAELRLAELPGQMALLASPLLAVAPYFIWLLIASIPILYLRQRRRTRVQKIDEDFSIFLEFLVVLASAGMGFDDALSRVLGYFDRSRPIPQAFYRFQAELLSGSSRSRGYWRLMQSLPTPEVRSFIVALLHSSEHGGAINDLLRHQAADSLSKRKTRALEWAAGLPVRLLLPMLLCFLPGIWIVGLGPVLHQFLKIIEPTIRTFGG